MADKAIGKNSASIFLDEIKSSLAGNLNYEPSVEIASTSGEGWVFSERAVSTSAGVNLLYTSDTFMGTSSAIINTDIIMWIAVKNLSTVATEGVALSLDANGSNAYNDVDAIIIGAGEMVTLKLGVCTVNSLHARAVTMDGTYGYATADATSGTVLCHTAAIIKNIS